MADTTGTNLHPDIVAAINHLSTTSLGKKFDSFARKKYGVSGAVLAAKQTAGEFGGNDTKNGSGAVSSAGARGPGQFIPSTRQTFITKYGIDPWKDDASALKALEIYDMQVGVAGYNPGMPTYTQYVLGQKLSPASLSAIRGGSAAPSATAAPMPAAPAPAAPTAASLAPTQALDQQKDDLKNQFLLGGNFSMASLLNYKNRLAALTAATPAPAAPTNTVPVTPAPPAVSGVRTTTGPKGSEVLELIHNDGSGKPGYGIKNGQTVNGGQVFAAVWQGHENHVHVAAGPKTVVALGNLAQSMGLKVSENSHFGGVTPGAHVPGSYHYKDEAIDVDGTPQQMDSYARAVVNYNKTHVLPSGQ